MFTHHHLTISFHIIENNDHEELINDFNGRNDKN